VAKRNLKGVRHLTDDGRYQIISVTQSLRKYHFTASLAVQQAIVAEKWRLVFSRSSRGKSTK